MRLREAPEYDQACKINDVEQVDRSLAEFTRSGACFRQFQCHMGLIDVTHIVQLNGYPIAMLISGQFRPPDGLSGVTRALEASNPPDPMTGKFLLDLAGKLQPCPEDIEARMQREARHIERLALAEYTHQKAVWEQKFLSELRHQALEKGELDRDQLVRQVGAMLQQVVQYCLCEYALFYGSTNEKDTLLPALADVGLPNHITPRLPHFNWRKSGLPLEHFDINSYPIAGWLPEARNKGLRGENSEFFRQAGCVIPVLLGNRYRGILVMGPLRQVFHLEDELPFLIEIAHAIGRFALSALEVFDLEQERKAWNSGKELLTHQLKTALVPITNLGGLSSLRLRSRSPNPERVAVDLQTALKMAINLRDSAKETLDLRQVEVEPDDLEFERYPLSVLVGNVAAGFVEHARQRSIELIIEPSVEHLPDADVDVARLTIAIANIIENATKYAFADTSIKLRSRYEPPTNTSRGMAYIEVDDLGLGFNQPEAEKIFQKGERGEQAYKVAGTGFGLWEAKGILQAHGGDIKPVATLTNFFRRDHRAYHVVFTIEIPLRRAGHKGKGD
jgi:signal transduction histidine kinase